MIELRDRGLNRRGDLVEAAAEIYRFRLEQQPDLADFTAANGRQRELSWDGFGAVFGAAAVN